MDNQLDPLTNNDIPRPNRWTPKHSAEDGELDLDRAYTQADRISRLVDRLYLEGTPCNGIGVVLNDSLPPTYERMRALIKEAIWFYKSAPGYVRYLIERVLQLEEEARNAVSREAALRDDATEYEQIVNQWKGRAITAEQKLQTLAAEAEDTSEELGVLQRDRLIYEQETSRLRAENTEVWRRIEGAKEYQTVTEQLLDDWRKFIASFPECKVHGPDCKPHALEVFHAYVVVVRLARHALDLITHGGDLQSTHNSKVASGALKLCDEIMARYVVAADFKDMALAPDLRAKLEAASRLARHARPYTSRITVLFFDDQVATIDGVAKIERNLGDVWRGIRSEGDPPCLTFADSSTLFVKAWRLPDETEWHDHVDQK